MSDSVSVVMLKDLVHYLNGVNRVFFPKGTTQIFLKEKADKFLRAGYCELLEKPESFDTRETKPALLKKETKPAAKKAAVKKTARKKTASKKVKIEKQSNNSADD